MQGFAQFLEQGGPLMYVNLITSVVVLAVIIDRLIFFFGKSAVNARALTSCRTANLKSCIMRTSLCFH